MGIKSFSETVFEKLYEPGKERPVLVVGLPGVGGVGRIVAELIRELTDARLCCKVYSPYFPDQIRLEDGSYELLNYKIYHSEVGGRDVLILTGDFHIDPTPVEAAYTVAENIVDYVLNLGCGRIVAVDGSLKLEGIAVTSNNPDVLKNLLKTGVKPYKGYLSGLAGLILGMTGFKRNAVGVGVLVGCRNVERDEEAALRALSFLNTILGLNLSV